MAASGSVFAKQFAGRIRQVGPDGEASRPAAAPGPKASAPRAVAAKGQISAPAARSKAATGASTAAKAKPKSAIAPPSPQHTNVRDDEESDDNGGVMTCANRNLLQQMLQKAERGNDDNMMGHDAPDKSAEGDGDLSMSMRLVPGTPKAGSQRRSANVPTISSPSYSKAPSMRAVSSTSVPTLSAKAVSSTAPSSNMPKASIGASAAGPKVVAAGSMHPWAQPKAKAATSVPVPKVLTGPPQRTNIAPAPARPSSRHGPPPVQEVALSRPVTPASVGTPSGARNIATPGSMRGPSSYAGMHAARAKASPAKAGAASKPILNAGRPMCGCSAFDMLREREAATAAKPAAGDPEDVDNDASAGDGFLMPDESVADSLEGDQGQRLAEVEIIDPPTSSSISNPRASSPEPETAESAADYVERIKRSMGMQSQGPAPTTSASPVVPEASASVDVASRSSAAPTLPQAPSSSQSTRSRPRDAAAAAAKEPRAHSSDARAAPSAAKPGNGLLIRSQSSDPRPPPVAVQDAKCVAAAADLDDSDDDDEVLPAAGVGFGKPGGEPWKLDVKAMVKDFAREERARSDKTRPPDRVAKAPRPPKAPSVAKAPASPAAVDSSKYAAEAPEKTAPGEQLFFSRKPRGVEFTPGSLDEFKHKGYGKKEISQLGKLGPDLDDEELLMKKAVREKEKQFSKELQKINQKRMAEAARKGIKPEPKQEPKPTARAKAAEFARGVPKPPQLSKPHPLRPKESDAGKENAPSQAAEEQADLEEIRRREKQHFDDVLRVKDIKDFLSKLPY